MEQQNGHVDGDDYTWDGASTGGAVFNPLPASAALDPDSPEAWRAAVAELAARTWPDLRTGPEQERDDVGYMNLRIDRAEQLIAEMAGELYGLRELVRLTTGPVDVDLRDDTAQLALREMTVALARVLEARIETLEETVELLLGVLEASVVAGGNGDSHK